MNTVTPLNNSREMAARIFPQESERYFRVAERNLFWHNARTGEKTLIENEKALIREQAGGGAWLANVGRNYKLITNEEFDRAIEQEMVDNVQPEYLHGVKVRDTMAYNGRDSFREYIFPNMQVNLRQTTCAFRILTWLSYGKGSVKLAAGAIDWACDNGMVSGSAERHTRRHTSGLSIAGIARWLNSVVEQFWTRKNLWREWEASPFDDEMMAMIINQLVKQGVISAQRASWLSHRIDKECMDRGNRSLWEIYSALTYWATHSNIRQTGNDHTAVTRFNRQDEAQKIMNNVVRLYKDAA